MSDTFYCAMDGTPFEADWEVRCECTTCMPLDAPHRWDDEEEAMLYRVRRLMAPRHQFLANRLASLVLDNAQAKWVTAFTAYQKALSEPYFDQDDESRQSNRAEVDRTYKALCALAKGE